jgi:hypothetical protein
MKIKKVIVIMMILMKDMKEHNTHTHQVIMKDKIQ